MRRIILLAYILFYMFTNAVYAEEAHETSDSIVNTEAIILEQLDKLDVGNITEIMDSINRDLDDYFPKIDYREYIIKIIKGEATFNFTDVVEGSFRLLFREVMVNWNLLVQIIILSLVYAILSNLQSSFENKTISKLAYNVCYLMIASLVIKSFFIAINIGKEAIEMMVAFMQVLTPIVLTLILTMGGLTTATFFHPILFGGIGFIGTIIKSVVLPLLIFSAVLSVVSNLSTKIQISRLANLFKQTAIALLGFILTIFIGIISIQGIAAASVDGIGLRTTKFAIERFIPIVGGFLSDAMDTVIGCTLVLKNGIGALGFLVIFLICLLPIIKILSLVVVYRLCIAIIEPIAEKQLIDFLSQMSNTLLVLFAAVVAVAVMFFITIAVVVSTGNITLMMR
ncbi:MAG: stage III sporulation protein AE [Alkaliphilus sp.]